MKKAIKIRKDDSLITSEPDDSVNGLAFLANKKVHFLPINIAESFPNLLGLSSWGCPIKVISRKHLKNLHKLKLLNLGRNKIEIIKKDTFKDLRSLEWIGLSIFLISLICNFSFMFKNHFRLDQGKIKHVNAAAFDGLLKLHTVYIDRLGRKCNLRPILIFFFIHFDIDRNECMDENFQNRDEISKMYQIIAENCGFSELDKPSIACSYDEKDILIDNKCLIDE